MKTSWMKIAIVCIASLALCVSALGVQAQTTRQTKTSTDRGPPLVNGFYIYRGCEGEGGCSLQQWRANRPTQLLDSNVSGARVIATLSRGEFVTQMEVITRIKPLRGVVIRNHQSMRVGDVIYRLEYEGEGVGSFWIGGRKQSSDDLSDSESNIVRWDREATPTANQGLWAKVRRRNGQIGWLKDPSMDCMSMLGGDEGCRN